ncbi:MAG: hypothetical protein COA38_10205 [Fluviicola sp.]|nr:MAG: hypothetical protein COA38_10205 [Fluviicola sp.]
MKKVYSILLLTALSFSSRGQCTGPTAICQNINVYLDAAGTATILASDIDNGSTDDCATGSLTFSASQTAFTCADIGTGPGLMITGAYDGPLSGGTPKGVELYAGSAIADLSVYGLGSANNGGGTDGEEFTFPAISVAAGTFIYVTTDSAQFNIFFGFNADFITGSMGINGDDAVELFQGGVVIDVFGDINTDGSGQPWDFLDGWAYRNDLQGTNGGTFTSTNWTYSGINTFDGQTSNATSPIPFPVGTYTALSAGISVMLTVTDGLGDTGSCTALVTVLDTIAPIADLATLADEAAACEVLTLTVPTAADNCSGPITGTTSTTFPISASTVVTWMYDDGNGNITTQDQNVIISDNIAPVADATTLADLVDDCEVSPIAPTATDNCLGTITGTSTITFPVTASTTITWTYDDGNGNITTQDQIVTINGLDVTTTLVSTTITSNAIGGPLTYQWIDCSNNSAVAGEINQSFTATLTGDYAVIIDNGTCSDTSACVNVLVTTCPGPTAVCQDIIVYLDGTGNATIGDTDIDGGSTDDCVTGGITMSASQTAFSCTDLSSGSGMIITGTYDGPLPGGLPKGVELYVGSAIADLSNYGIGSANNGGGTDGEEFTFPAIAVPAGTFIYMTTDSAAFNAFFGFDADFIDGSMSINGDDAVELFQGGVVIDVFGDINTDGNGEPWEYLDGWAYRNDLEAANAGVFDYTNWMYSGINVFDGQTTNATSPSPFPVGTYLAAGSGTPVTLTVTDGLMNTDQCTALVTVLDTLVPIADLATLADVSGDCEVTTITAPTASDNCAGLLTGTTTTTFPITASGTTVVTWTFVDASGNVLTQDQNVIISDVTAPAADLATLTDLSDDCEVAMPTAPTATDNCAGAITGTTTTTFPITSSTTITWTYDDGNGNTITQDQIVTINGLDVTTTLVEPTITANATGVTYQWIDCSDNSAIAGETAQDFEAMVTGDYAVIITDGNCSDTSACVNVEVGGIENLVDLGMTVSPNPSAGIFNVSFDNTVSGIVTIVDANGRLIQSQELNNNSLLVDLTAYQSGLYFMQVATENGVSRERIVKF